MKYLHTFKSFLNEEFLPGTVVMLNLISKEAKDAMFAYFKVHKNAYEHEIKMSGMDPLKFPIEYFKYELREPEHKEVLDSINKTGIMTLSDFENWKEVNAKEESLRIKNTK